jgi:hypothetical protein
VELVLELFLFTPEGSRAVRYHCLQQEITGRRCDPDDILAEILDTLKLTERRVRMAHSTSWRYEAGRTVLTYLVWVKERGLQGLPTFRTAVDNQPPPACAGPLRPRPLQIGREDVLIHGLRHLRHLLCERRDPVLAEALADIDAAGLLAGLSPAVAGRIA